MPTVNPGATKLMGVTTRLQLAEFKNGSVRSCLRIILLSFLESTVSRREYRAI